MQIIMQPIGVIHSPFTEKDQTPIQASRSKAIGKVELDPEFLEGLQDLEGFSHIFLLYAFHGSSGYSLRVKPFLDHDRTRVVCYALPMPPKPDWDLNRPFTVSK